MKKWLGLKALVHDGVDATLELIREGHESSSRVALRVTDQIEPLRGPARKVDDVRRMATDAYLGTFRVANRAVELLTNAGIDAATQGREFRPETPLPMRSDVIGTKEWLADAAIAAVNGAVGDHLEGAHNALGVGMLFRAGDSYLELEPDRIAEVFEHASSRLVVFVHGLAATEWSWVLEAEGYHGDPAACFGTLLERDLGFTPVFLRYNTGRHVSENGRAFAAMLQRLVDLYPHPIEDLTLMGHSMGGLVVRSASLHAEETGLAWPELVRRVFYLGSPHRGAPLAKFGQVLGEVLTAVDLPATQIVGQIVENRSSGVKDLRHGGLVDEEWLSRHPVADRETLPIPHANHVFISATVTEETEHTVGQLIGDMLVRVPSASGPAQDSTFAIETSTFGGIMHHQLQNHPSVYAEILRLCRG